MMPVPWKLWEGQVVDLTFPLRRYLGSTSQSAVFLTQLVDPEPRNAAIKLVVSPAHDAELFDQWDHAATLSHPNLLQLFRKGTCEINQMTLDYVVTEFAEENLADVLSERPLTVPEAREMLGPLMDALAYLHAEGFVHGHVKPGNIMAVGEQLKLSVDGISRVGDLGAAPVRTGPYDPPEIGERGRSPLGDVWSFGMMLVQALTLELPVQSGPKQELVLPASLPKEFLPLVRACLRLDPRRRAPLSEIATLFREPEPQPVEQPRMEPPAAGRKWLSLALVSAAAMALAAFLAAPRLMTKPEVIAAPAQPAAKPAMPAPVQPPPAEPPREAMREAVAEAVPEAAPPVVVKPAPVPPRLTETLPDQVVKQVLPQITEQARRTIRGKVKIAVLATVDPSGHVADAKIESQNSRYFANLSSQAVRQWAFAPSDTATQWLLRFEFTTKTTEVHPARVSR